jgi:thiamine-monophosphate kinase
MSGGDEFDLLAEVYRKNVLLPSFVRVPPGDDMAALRFPAGDLLVAVDQVIEGRHVAVDAPAAMIGRKAVARNVSDVAAMAARPFATVVAVTLPRRYGRARALDLFEGLRATADAFGCPLVGGDTSIHADERAPLVCSVTILATPAWPGARIVTRRGGQLGDLVCVTGRLGASLAADGTGRHLTFEPRVPEGIELLERLGDRLHAMIDVSDGLGRDAAHLVEQDPSLAIELDAARFPCAAGADWRRALADGEDYELLFLSGGPVPPSAAGTPITVIGRVIEADGGPAVRVRAEGHLHDGTDAGWEHRGS